MTKKYALLLCLLLPICFLNLSCTGSTGPAGPAGTNGGYVMLFQQGVAPYASYAGCEDTRIADGAYIGDNWGALQNAITGSPTYPMKYRLILKFNLSAIAPATAAVDKAYLTLYTGSAITGALNITAYPLTEDWVEGTAAVQADADDGATWTMRTPALAWGTSGGTYDSSKPGSTAAVPATMYQPVTISINPATVESWIANSATNYGVIVIGSKEAEAANNYASFFTRDYITNPSMRPKLTVYLKP
jgi:hypothetical protein